LSSQDVGVEEIKEELGKLLPFLVEPKSTVLYESVRDTWAAVWERIGQELVSLAARRFHSR
jgi:hypothetical protein